MRLMHIGLIAFAVCLTGCRSKEPTVSEEKTTLTKRLTVIGPKEGVERFAKLQQSLRPPLPTSAIKLLADGRAQLVLTLPQEQTGADLVGKTREALAAGLSYEYEERKVTTGSNWKS